ncbi:MAG: hypothetical protein WCH01_14605, partial [Methylococcaceae bacterium]
ISLLKVILCSRFSIQFPLVLKCLTRGECSIAQHCNIRYEAKRNTGFRATIIPDYAAKRLLVFWNGDIAWHTPDVGWA